MMAEVVSGTELTVIILDDKESKALTNMLELHNIHEVGWPHLDELTNAMIGASDVLSQ
jgi:hypothetical protein